VPVAQHALFKTLAEQMRAGVAVETCLQAQLGSGSGSPARATPVLPPPLLLAGWRGWLLKALLPGAWRYLR
jgi:hypothetical protein